MPSEAFLHVSLICLTFLTLRADEHDHSFSLEVRNIVGFSEIFEVRGKSCEQQFTLLLEHDGASAEENVCLHFVSLFEELLRMFELEVVVVVIRLRSEPNLLHLLVLLVGFRFFLLFLLRVEELLVVNDATNRRVGGRSDLDQVKILLVGYVHSLLERVDTLFYIVADKAHLQDTANFIVDTMRVFFDNTTATRSG